MSTTTITTTTIFCGIIILLFATYSTTVAAGVNITNLKVPEYFIISDDGPDHIVLDCEYELDKKDKGFTLKWFRANDPFYQWIYGNKPYVFPHMIGKVNESYETSNDDDIQRYSAVVLLHPTKDLTDTYQCQVDEIDSLDRKSAHLKIIDFRNSSLTIKHDEDNDVIHVTCNVKNVYPRPFLQIRLNNDKDVMSVDQQQLDIGADGYYDAYITARLNVNDIGSDDEIECSLSFQDINYTTSRILSFSGDKENFSFLEQRNNNLPISGVSSLYSFFSKSYITIFFTVIVSIMLRNII